MGSEVKHTKTSDFGGEKGFLQGHAKKWVFCTLKCPEVRKGFPVSARHFWKPGKGDRVTEWVISSFTMLWLAADEETGRCRRIELDQSLGSQRPGAMWSWLPACLLRCSAYPTLCDTMNCSPPGSPVRGIPQARILEWVAIPFSRGSSRSRNPTRISCSAGRFFTVWATRETPCSCLSSS